MTERAGFVQGPPDISSGKRIGNVVVTLPMGTPVVNADGTATVLTVDTQVYLQKVVLADARGAVIESMSNESTQEKILDELQRIRRGIGQLCGDPFLDD